MAKSKRTRRAGPDYMKTVVLPERNKFLRVLEALVQTIEDTGGVVHDRKGLYQPLGDREWIDLGDVYVQACRAIGRQPKLVEDDEDGEDELPVWAGGEA